MDLIDFIIKAKIAGYATAGEAQKATFEDGSRGFIFESDGYRYRYYGFNPFSGTEFVFDRSQKLIWLMHYFGKVEATSDCEPDIVYAVLKKAMQGISKDFPFRGPPTLHDDGFIYENRQTGSVAKFQGNERILKKGVALYSLSYHGGSMK